jgi:hypothetical protein
MTYLKNIFSKKIVALTLGGLGLIILIFGYEKSDNVFYNELLKSNNITNPLQVFNWTTRHFGKPKSPDSHPYLSPRYLIKKHKTLWCDEGAIIMATLNHQLGYKTRLIDMYGYDNISHHTILQVLENNKWINYDFTFRLHNQLINISSDSLHIKLKEARIKEYPKFYNFLVNNNYFNKHIIFAMRGIKEEDNELY